MNQVPHLWVYVQRHMDATGVKEAAIATRAGTKPQTLNSWKNRGLRNLPDSWIIKAIATEIRADYDEFLKAILFDISYLPKEVVPDARPEQKTLTEGETLKPRKPAQG